MGDQIAPFWQWWRLANPKIASAIDTQRVTDFVDEISQQVHEIDPRLAWQLGPGIRSRHAFTLTPEGNFSLRRVTERWLRTSPAPDETWEYFPARQPAPNLRLEIAGRAFEAHDWRFVIEVDNDRLIVNLTGFHPSLGGLEEGERLQAGFIALDQLLGEDAVERWLGHLTFAPGPAPGSAASPPVLAKVLADMAAESAEERFSLAQGQDEDGWPLFLTVNQRLKRLDHLFAETRIQLDLTLQHPTDQGLTTEVEAKELNAVEDQLLAAGTAGVYLGRLTGRGKRSLYFYADNARQLWDALQAVLTRAASAWRPALTWEADPEWSFYREGMYRQFRRSAKTAN